MKCRITILNNDGTQENYTTDAPNYVSLERQLTGGQIQSFIVSRNKTPQP